MSRTSKFFLRRVLKSQSGTVLAWSVFLIPVVLAMGGVIVDVGRAYAGHRQLQASTNAAALAGAYGLPTGSTAIAKAQAYSSLTGEANVLFQGSGVSMVTGYPKPYCVTPTAGTATAGLAACSSGIPYNAIQVKQSATVQTLFIRILSLFGFHNATSITVTASATAAMRGAGRDPYNVAIIVDTTQSMTNSDNNKNCTGTRISCALQGVQVFLGQLSPCMANLSSCGSATNGNVANPVDEIALFIYPGVTTPAHDYDCKGKSPFPVISYPDATNATYATNLLPYYQILPLASDYRTADVPTGVSALNTLSNLVTASNGKSGCTGIQAEGGVGTYFAGAINTAQQYLAAQKTSRPTAQNVIILLSDGDASSATFSASSKYLNTNATYPSTKDLCQQAINVATTAKTAGTRIYTVGYGASNSGCSLDSPSISPCSTLSQIATSSGTFYADLSSACTGAQQTTTLSGIFTAIAGDLSLPRLIPDGTT